MKHELIKTEKYLLVVSHDKDEEGNFIYETNIGEVSRVDREYYELLKTGIKVEPFVKVLVHLPLNGSPYLDGLDVLPVLPEIEDEVESLALNHAEKQCEDMITVEGLTGAEWGWEVSFDFKAGYNKAKETYKYTEVDMQRSLLKMAQKCREEMDLPLPSYVNNISKNSDEIIQSLNQPKLPIAFECEMKEYGQYDCGVFMKDDEEQIKITNSEGRTEWVGKYIFNN